MKKIIHISDLHFGRENHQVIEALLTDIHDYQPDVVVVSGDLTQRARHSQFQKAAQFLEKITYPKVIVPGNHDVPLYDVTRRFLAPFNRYIRYINDDFFPAYINKELAIIGVNTAYSFTWKSGRVTQPQLVALTEKFQHQGDKMKMLVVHHPFHEIFSHDHHHQHLSNIGVDIVFSGHLHKASAKVLANHVAMLDNKTLIIEAGTSVSTRLRGESNSYNRVELVDQKNLIVIVQEFSQRQFTERHRSIYKKEDTHWVAIQR